MLNRKHLEPIWWLAASVIVLLIAIFSWSTFSIYIKILACMSCSFAICSLWASAKYLVLSVLERRRYQKLLQSNVPRTITVEATDTPLTIQDLHDTIEYKCFQPSSDKDSDNNER